MAKVKITGHASGTGILTVTAPNTSTDRTITLPDATGTLLTADGDGSSLTGVGVDGISSSADATAITIDSSENVGIGVVPESWNSSLTGLQIGDTGAISGGDTAWGGYLEIGSNFYRDSGGFKRQITGYAALTEYSNAAGSIKFKTADTDSADAAITLNTRLEITEDGRGLSQFTAKGWAQWDGATIADSHNVSSVANPSTGKYTVNWDVDMADGDYAIGTAGHADRALGMENQPTTADCDLVSYSTSGSLESGNFQSVICFGD